MKKTYLILSILGFIAPNIFVMKESIETGNLLFWLNPVATINGMFANQISTAFVVDLLFVVMVFMFWTYQEAKKSNFEHVWLIWVLTFIFGLAGSLPLFLYLLHKKD